MSCNRSVHIPGKIGIDGCSRVSRQHRDALGDLTPDGFGGTNYRDWLGVSFDDDLRASLHSLQDGPDILDQISLADVQHARSHTKLMIALPRVVGVRRVGCDSALGR